MYSVGVPVRLLVTFGGRCGSAFAKNGAAG
jgi:hypothetical protein